MIIEKTLKRLYFVIVIDCFNQTFSNILQFLIIPFSFSCQYNFETFLKVNNYKLIIKKVTVRSKKLWVY